MVGRLRLTSAWRVVVGCDAYGTSASSLANQTDAIELTSLLFSTQVVTISGVNSSVKTFFSVAPVHAGPLLTTPMFGPNRESCGFLSLPLFDKSPAGLALLCMAVATRAMLVSVLAK